MKSPSSVLRAPRLQSVFRVLTFGMTPSLAALEARDYKNIDNPSLLRFLVDMKGEECDNKQMRDDLITMLIAGTDCFE